MHYDYDSLSYAYVSQVIPRSNLEGRQETYIHIWMFGRFFSKVREIDKKIDNENNTLRSHLSVIFLLHNHTEIHCLLLAIDICNHGLVLYQKRIQWLQWFSISWSYWTGSLEMLFLRLNSFLKLWLHQNKVNQLGVLLSKWVFLKLNNSN